MIVFKEKLSTNVQDKIRDLFEQVKASPSIYGRARRMDKNIFIGIHPELNSTTSYEWYIWLWTR